MERTQVYLDRSHKQELQKMAKEKRTTMAELVREAVVEYLAKSNEESEKKIINTKGLWADRTDITDSDSYVNEMREKWNITPSDTEV
ncbi:MAG TPA: CopG family transcriptional regulator [Clostridiales bacterium]|nr:CopG family transcriptional regulator [Clostridiales bacterium]